MRVRFQVNASTQMGEQIFMVGSPAALGAWDLGRAVPLQTSSRDYPLWWVDVEDVAGESEGRFSLGSRVEYQYLRGAAGKKVWESEGKNRWIPVESTPGDHRIVVVEGWFGEIPVWPHSYWQDPPPSDLGIPGSGQTIVLLGSSVARGCGAWLLRGWAALLEEHLRQRFGHRLINQAQLGATVASTHAQFEELVLPHRPDRVIISLSLANEGLPQANAAQQRKILRHFESGLLHLIERVQALGAEIILGGLYPHQGYTPEHDEGLKLTQSRMNCWGIPIWDWLGALEDGHGHWQTGLAWDAGHPNSLGHLRMFGCINLDDCDHSTPQSPSTPLFRDPAGLQISRSTFTLQIQNPTPYSYGLCPDWDDLQRAVQAQPTLLPGLYVSATLPSLALSTQPRLLTHLEIPALTQEEWRPAAYVFRQHHVLFDDGQVGILKDSQGTLHLLNESSHSYNIHPMWSEVRQAFAGVEPGIYEDANPSQEFRTAMVGPGGLESRVKLPPLSHLRLTYQGSLASRPRIGILSLGDRCAVRMMLYKMDYDGPAFPFDLTRTTHLGDVADIIAQDFRGMWDPEQLEYRAEEHRIYHRRWLGLSFAHEVEAHEDPSQDMAPILARMQRRYHSRAQRFRFTLTHADHILFVRTGVAERGTVAQLLTLLRQWHKPFRLLILSEQSGEEFAGLAEVIHHPLTLNPDRMYADENHWQACTEQFREILNALGVSSRTLFWCPPL